MIEKNFKSGFLLICGVPNAGKSTLLNNILGEKIAAVTDKPQTTRKRITGILTEKDLNLQLIFIDTPGFHTSNKIINQLMNEQIFESIKEIDLILFITDISKEINEDEISLISRLEEIKNKLNKKIVALLNKIDKGKNENKVQFLNQKNLFDKFLEISAISLDKTIFLEQVYPYIPEHPFYYPEDIISTMYDKEQVVEIVQEKLFLNLFEEVPYSTYVEVLQFKETEDLIDIEANICCEKESQKPIIIGKNAEVIKKIRLMSEKDLKFIFGKKVKLHLFVKVVKNWSKNNYILKELGFNVSKIKKT
ncbi:MAG TPA: GTPase Era [Exilispira sp.]|nr:GTPase Era [Exilispira sp.]